MLIMNAVRQLDGLVRSQLVAGVLNAVAAFVIFRKVNGIIRGNMRINE